MCTEPLMNESLFNESVGDRSERIHKTKNPKKVSNLGRGRVHSTKFYTGRLRDYVNLPSGRFFSVSQTKREEGHLIALLPRCPTPCPFIHHFWQKSLPFRTPSIDRWFPFCTPGLELCMPFNCSKCTFFEIWINHKTRMFCRLFRTHKTHLLALLGLFAERHDKFPTLS